MITAYLHVPADLWSTWCLDLYSESIFNLHYVIDLWSVTACTIFAFKWSLLLTWSTPQRVPTSWREAACTRSEEETETENILLIFDLWSLTTHMLSKTRTASVLGSSMPKLIFDLSIPPLTLLIISGGGWKSSMVGRGAPITLPTSDASTISLRSGGGATWIR